ncbi:phage baseplate protein [Mangrovibacter yixingensis]|uniref:phage baseplate protein n=1 Tax=Mangrovibacter yixingensis TaxID=1529639 RepID=UPI001CFF36D5|nr:hypothetical protein [Mangrovibacter yixingensis]
MSILQASNKDHIMFHKKDDLSVVLSLSATTDMKYTSNIQVTTQPVQSGQTITDNVQEVPETIVINGVVVVDFLSAYSLDAVSATAVQDFLDTLQTWRSQKQILTVLCDDGISLTNAVCTNFEANKDASISNGLRVSLTFQNADFVVQIGQTTASINSSGSVATTQDGAVTTQKEIGTSTTSSTVSGSCAYFQALSNLNYEGLSPSDVSKAREALARCQLSANVSGGKIQYTSSSETIASSIYRSMGGNVNKISN